MQTVDESHNHEKLDSGILTNFIDTESVAFKTKLLNKFEKECKLQNFKINLV